MPLTATVQLVAVNTIHGSLPADVQQYWVGGVHFNGDADDGKQYISCWAVRRQNISFNVGTERQITKRRSHSVAENTQGE